jgi:hypothetical protein
MVTPTIAPELKKLALDFNKPNTYPRSPREMLAGYVIAARIVDKCRAILNGTGEEYNYNCPLDRFFFDFTGIDADALETFVATGASDEAVSEWIQQHSKIKEKIDIVKWNNEWRYKTIDQLPDRFQLFIEEDVFEQKPLARLLYFFDKLDLDEGRL